MFQTQSFVEALLPWMLQSDCRRRLGIWTESRKAEVMSESSSNQSLFRSQDYCRVFEVVIISSGGVLEGLGGRPPIGLPSNARSLAYALYL